MLLTWYPIFILHIPLSPIHFIYSSYTAVSHSIPSHTSNRNYHYFLNIFYLSYFQLTPVSMHFFTVSELKTMDLVYFIFSFHFHLLFLIKDEDVKNERSRLNIFLFFLLFSFYF